MRGCRGRDRMVVGFTTTCVSSAYHHTSCVFEPHSLRGVLDNVAKINQDQRQFLTVLI
jgi:hypothetical protein